MRKLIITAAAVGFVVAAAGPTFAAGKKTGFSTESGQGTITNDSSNNETNSGTTSISGPYGQVKQGKDANTTVDLPGKNR